MLAISRFTFINYIETKLLKKVIVKRNKYIHPSVFGYVKNSANFIKLREKRPFNNILVEIYDRNKIFKGRTSSFDLYNTRQKKILS